MVSSLPDLLLVASSLCLPSYLAKDVDSLEDAEEDEDPSEERRANHRPPKAPQLRHASRQLKDVVTGGETRRNDEARLFKKRERGRYTGRKNDREWFGEGREEGFGLEKEERKEE